MQTKEEERNQIAEDWERTPSGAFIIKCGLCRKTRYVDFYAKLESEHARISCPMLGITCAQRADNTAKRGVRMRSLTTNLSFNPDNMIVKINFRELVPLYQKLRERTDEWCVLNKGEEL